MDKVDTLHTLMLSAQEVADEIRKTPQHISDLCRRGEIRAKRISGRWVITRPALDEYKSTSRDGRSKH